MFFALLLVAFLWCLLVFVMFVHEFVCLLVVGFVWTFAFFFFLFSFGEGGISEDVSLRPPSDERR